MEPRLRALCDLMVPEVREYAGRHEYDGGIQDLSPDGVSRAVAALGGPPLADAHDERHLAAFEAGARVAYGELQLHRANPLLHVSNLDLAAYDRGYAPQDERDEARRRHLAAWPDAVDMALEALDRVPADLARGALASVRGLASQATDEASRAAQQRFAAHVERAAEQGEADPALGGAALARLMGAQEALEVDLDALAAQADAERDRLRDLLDEACRRIDPDAPVEATLARIESDLPAPDGVLDEARAMTAEVIAWTAERGLVPQTDGECLVGPSPASRASAFAMVSWAAPGEPEAPTWYYITPPDPSWPADQQAEWLAGFHRAALTAITLHEVAPGHFSHGRALRHAGSDVRRTLFSPSFVEGWAHYAEEVAVEEGFRGGDPRVQAGVAIEALVRVTRLASAIGIHRGELTVQQAAQRFTADAHLQGPAALSEARRATWDPTYGRYTWGKLLIQDLRSRARTRPGFELAAFHRDLLALGAPPLGLLDAALA